VSSLDIRKAFDRVNHYKMYKSLLEVGVPVIIVDTLCNWYSKLFYAIEDGMANCLPTLQCVVVSDRAAVSHLLFLMFL